MERGRSVVAEAEKSRTRAPGEDLGREEKGGGRSTDPSSVTRPGVGPLMRTADWPPNDRESCYCASKYAATRELNSSFLKLPTLTTSLHTATTHDRQGCLLHSHLYVTSTLEFQLDIMGPLSDATHH